MSDQSTPLMTVTVRLAAPCVRGRLVNYAKRQAVPGDICLGVAAADGRSNELVQVTVLGSASVEAGGIFAEGAPLTADANGRVVLFTGGGYCVGRAMSPSVVAGQFVEMLLNTTAQENLVSIEKTLTGGMEFSVGIEKISGIIPLDFPIMHYRPVGKMTTFQVPSPYDSLPNPYVIHPSVCYVPGGFSGAKYWMAFTPLNGNNSVYENPCIVCSDDINGPWRNPPGLVNPLAESSNPGTVYNRDTHLYFDSKNSVMVLMWNCKGEASTNKLKIRTSTDCVSWTPEVTIWSGDQGTSDMASPSLWYDDLHEKWVCVGHNVVDAGREVRKITSSSLLSNWGTSPSSVTFPSIPGRKWWHSWFTRLASGRVVGVAMDNNGGAGSPGYVYVCQSMDDCVTIESAWIAGSNNAELYRPTACFIERNGEVELSVIHSRLSKNFFLVQKLLERTSRTRESETAIVGGLLSYAGRAKSSSILFADDFNRADSSLGLGATLDNKTWIQSSGSALVGILNNMTYPATPGGNDIATINVGVPSYSVYAVNGVSGALSAWVLVNFNNDSNFIRVGLISSRLAIQKYEGSKTYEVVWDATHPLMQIVVLPGDVIRIDVSGASLRIYFNGELVHEVDAICISGYNKVGIQTSGASGYCQWDAIVVDSY